MSIDEAARCIAGDDPHAPLARLGGKAGALWRLGTSGFPVPPWFAVVGGSMPPPESLEPDLARQIAEWACALAGPERLVAVRSSAMDEDGFEHSFAGQLDTFLDVASHDVPTRVIDVWRSGASARVLAYRTERGLGPPSQRPAVLVQRMVRADRAGVAMSVDPVSGRRAHAVVAAVPGLGEALVSGQRSADTYRVDLSDRIVETELADVSAAPLLRSDEVVAVAALARRCEAFFGRAQDIEWAFSHGHLYLLQSRPITSLGRVADPDGVLQIWDDSNIAESYCGVTTPLTYSFARYIYEEVYWQLCRILGVPESKLEASSTIFGRMLGLVRGRIYYSLLDWYKALALLPGFQFNRRFMEQMMGVSEALPDELAAQIQHAGLQERLTDLGHLVGTVVGLVRHRLRLGHVKRAFDARFEEALRKPDPPLNQQRLDELVAYYRGLERQLLTRWDAPLINDFFAMVYFGVLRRLCGSWLDAATLANDLVGGQGGMVSTEPARLVEEMAQIAASDESLSALLDRGRLDEIRAALPRSPALEALVREYLARFGDRCMEELKLESPTLHDDPTLLFRSVAMRARSRIVDAGARRRFDARAAAEARVASRLGRSPLRRLVFGRVLRQARHAVRDRENLRLQRTRLFARVREVFLEIGGRLAEIGALAERRDVFYLTVQEALAFVDGTAVGTDLRGLVALRRKEFDAYRKGPAPADRFETRGAVYVGNPFESRRPVQEGAAQSRRGLACCPGIVRGPVRVVLDPGDARLEPGEILVAARTDPGWVMLFPAASGLIVEHGSLLSHSAIVARELGLPAIVALSGATSWLTTGDLVEMDGASGEVRRIEVAAP